MCIRDRYDIVSLPSSVKPLCETLLSISVLYCAVDGLAHSIKSVYSILCVTVPEVREFLASLGCPIALHTAVKTPTPVYVTEGVVSLDSSISVGLGLLPSPDVFAKSHSR